MGHPFDILMSSRYHHDVRTTLTLDEDIAAKIRAEMRRSEKSLKQVVNEFLRLGLLSTRQLQSDLKPFRVRARRLGVRAGLDYDNVAELLEQLEGPQHR